MSAKRAPTRTVAPRPTRMINFPSPFAAEPYPGELDMPPMAFGDEDDAPDPGPALVISQTELRPDASHDGFVHRQDPPAEWIQSLRETSPKSTEIGWLYLHWEPGEPWVPGQRWTLYEMLNEEIYREDENSALLAEFHGPHPRSSGHMCADKVPGQFQCLCRRKFQGWRGGPCSLITLSQYDIYHKTGFIPLPFWVIQGTTGGHKFEFNDREQELLRLEGLPGDTPRLGSLPYAPFDGRVKRQVVRHNRLMQMDATISEFKETMGKGYDAYKRDVARSMRENYVKYLATQMADVSEDFIRAARKGEMADEPKTDIDFVKLEEIASQHYVDTGEVLAPEQVQ